MNKADLGIVLFFTGLGIYWKNIGIPAARFCISGPFTSEYLRRYAFK